MCHAGRSAERVHEEPRVPLPGPYHPQRGAAAGTAHIAALNRTEQSLIMADNDQPTSARSPSFSMALGKPASIASRPASHRRRRFSDGRGTRGYQTAAPVPGGRFWGRAYAHRQAQERRGRGVIRPRQWQCRGPTPRQSPFPISFVARPVLAHDDQPAASSATTGSAVRRGCTVKGGGPVGPGRPLCATGIIRAF